MRFFHLQRLHVYNKLTAAAATSITHAGSTVRRKEIARDSRTEAAWGMTTTSYPSRNARGLAVLVMSVSMQGRTSGLVTG